VCSDPAGVVQPSDPIKRIQNTAGASTQRADAGVGQGSPLLRETGPAQIPALRGSSSGGNK
jgi:hypothetical protein